MRITESWEEVVDMVEKMILYIFSRLPKECSHEIDIIKKAYPEAGSFKLPQNGAPRIKFAEGIQMLREAGHEASENEDIRYAIPPPDPFLFLLPPKTMKAINPFQTQTLTCPFSAPQTKKPSAA